jgi:hypothetical protein
VEALVARASDVPEGLAAGAPGRDAVGAAIELRVWDRRRRRIGETTWLVIPVERWFWTATRSAFAHLGALARY